MPLIDVTLRPGYVFPELELRVDPRQLARRYFRELFGPELPPLFVRNSGPFGMDPETPQSGVQVQFHDYDKDDINVPDVWVKVQFSEAPPEMTERADIVNSVFDALVGIFHAHDMNVPDNFIMDLFWGPTHGCGRVNGTHIEW